MGLGNHENVNSVLPVSDFVIYGWICHLQQSRFQYECWSSRRCGEEGRGCGDKDGMKTEEYDDGISFKITDQRYLSHEMNHAD